MPLFSPDDAQALASEVTACDREVALDGLDAAAAIAACADALTEAGAAGLKRIWLRFAPAGPQTGETLFLPVGRFLKSELAAGRIRRAVPAQAGGWIVRLAPDGAD